MAPHNVECTYNFHGTFDPGTGGDDIAYSDTFKYQIRTGLFGTARVNIIIGGSFTLLERPCAPGRPC